MAARACGAAHVRLLWSVDLFARMRGLFLELMAGRPAGEREDVLADWLGGHLGRFGERFAEDVVCGQSTIDYLPASLRLQPDGPGTSGVGTSGVGTSGVGTSGGGTSGVGTSGGGTSGVGTSGGGTSGVGTSGGGTSGVGTSGGGTSGVGTSGGGTSGVGTSGVGTSGVGTSGVGTGAVGTGAVEYVPMRYVPYNGRAVVPGWLRVPPRRPRVALTLGSSWTTRLGRYAVPVQDILDALSGLDVEVVATLSAKQQAELTRVPGNTRLAEYVPLHALAPTCQVVINQGGPGTVCTTAAYGVPQLVLHYDWFDEPLLARGLVRAGAGAAVPSGEVTAAGVREQVVRLLGDPSFAEGAGRLRAEMAAMPAPNDIVPRLEKLTEEHRRASGSGAPR